jgi:diguanylate cyclase (GGDEF)-like protein/PAS domain S-box-containing protein
MGVVLHGEGLFEGLLESSPDGIVIVDPSGIIRMVNRQAEALFGYSRAEFIGLPVGELVPTRFREKHTFDHSHPSELPTIGAVDSDLDLCGLRRDRTEFPIEITVSPLKTDEGMLFAVATRDVTKRRAAEVQARRLAAIVDSSDDAIVSEELDGTITSWNRAAELLYGYSSEEIIGSPITVLLPEARGREIQDILTSISKGQSVENRETTRLRKDGSSVEVSLTVSPIKDERGRVIGASSISHDISGRKQMDMALRLANMQFTSAFDHALIGMAMVDLSGQFLQINPAFCRITGYSEQELQAANETVISYPGDQENEQQDLARLLAGEIPSYHVEKRYRHAEGHVVWTLVGVSLIVDHEGKPLHLIRQIEDITERKEAVERLTYQAVHDSLTGLANRSLLQDRLNQAISRAAREKSITAVMFLDLDHFKLINDSHGHDEGDKVLVEVARRLSALVRPGDTVARLGGDEFVVVCERVDSEAQVIQIAQRLHEGLSSSPIALPSGTTELVVSIGIALTHGSETDSATLLRHADAAMYRVKERGRGRFEIFDAAMQDQALEHLRIESDLRLAIEHGDLRVYYQPQVRLTDGKVVGVEALVRWQHPDRGLLEPADFIDVAEQGGVILPLGRWVLQEACRNLPALEASLGADLSLAVNVSARELGQANYPEVVQKIISDAGIDPAQLFLEITESIMVNVGHSTRKTVGALRNMGVQIVLDDFGTGYSSLSYIKEMPVDILKIDRSFTAGLGEDPGDLAIAGSVVKLAHSLGLTCVAEGIETDIQAAILRELHCDVGQGFYFAVPQSLESLSSPI